MMHRRHFSAALGSAAVLGLSPLPVVAQSAFVPGKDFRVLDKRAPVEAPAGKFEVVAFFWYACPHCNAFEHQLTPWAKRLPADVVLKRVPVAFNSTFEPQQRLFYTLEAMGKVAELHDKVFQAIHGERLKLEKADQIMAWAEKMGLDKNRFQEVFNSFGISTKARRATQLGNEYGLEGVPTLGIAGRWWTDGGLAGSMPRALQVAEFLLGQARRGQ